MSEFLDKIRGYLKKETMELYLGANTEEEMVMALQNYYVDIGRRQMLEDILKCEQNMSEREFQVARRKGTL